MDLYNTQTRQREDIEDPEELQAAIRNKTHGFEVGQKIPAINPYGEKVWIQSDEAHAKAAEGYRFPTKSEQDVERFVDANSGPLAGIGVGIAQAADEFALGLPELIYNKTANPLDVAKKEALKKEHKYANAIGGIAGFTGGLLLGGPVNLAARVASKAGEKTTAHLAAKLGAMTGEAVGKRTLGTVAKQLTARTAGMGVEGGVFALPHAITEASLGDPEAAAEHFLGGVGIGALFGAGTGLGKEAYKVGASVFKDVQEAAKQKGITLAWLNRKLAQTFTGVPEENIQYYLENMQRLETSPPLPKPNLIESINNAVRPYEDRVKELKEAIKTNRTSQSVADELGLSLKNIKEVQGELSTQADEALAAIPGGVDVSDLRNFVIQAKEKYIPVEVGKVAKAAAKELDDLALDLKKLEKPDTQIPFPLVRDIWQMVRKNVSSWRSPEFNSISDAALKDISSKMRNLVKGRSEEFEGLMAKSRELAELHDLMIKKGFGDRNKAASIFDRVVKGQSQIDRELLAKYDAATSSNFSSQLDSFNSLRSELAAAEADYLPLHALSERQIESAIKNQGFKDPRDLYTKAFTNLEEKTKIPFLQMIRDYNVVNSFNRASTQGSRKAVTFGSVGAGVGTAVGGIPGGIMGAGAGSVAGMIADVYGGQFLKSLMGTYESKAGLLFVEKALKKNADRIDHIPGILERMATEKPKKYKVDTAAIGVLWRVLEARAPLFDGHKHEHKGLSESLLRLSDISERLTSLLSHPELLMDSLSRITEGLSTGGAPQIADAFTMVSHRVLQYLYSVLPKPPKPLSPFQKPIQWRPSDHEMFSFAQKLQVLEDPFMVLDALEDGTLTANHMEALQNFYPAIHAEIKNKILQIASSGAAEPLSYNQRIKLSLLLGTPLDSSLTTENIRSLQATFAKDQAPQQGQAQAPQANFKADIHPSYAMGQATQFQQLLEVRA